MSTLVKRMAMSSDFCCICGFHFVGDIINTKGKREAAVKRKSYVTAEKLQIIRDCEIEELVDLTFISVGISALCKQCTYAFTCLHKFMNTLKEKRLNIVKRLRPGDAHRNERHQLEEQKSCKMRRVKKCLPCCGNTDYSKVEQEPNSQCISLKKEPSGLIPIQPKISLPTILTTIDSSFAIAGFVQKPKIVSLESKSTQTSAVQFVGDVVLDDLWSPRQLLSASHPVEIQRSSHEQQENTSSSSDVQENHKRPAEDSPSESQKRQKLSNTAGEDVKQVVVTFGADYSLTLSFCSNCTTQKKAQSQWIDDAVHELCVKETEATSDGSSHNSAATCFDGKKFQECALQFLKKKLFLDLVLEINSITVTVHSLVLAMVSPVLQMVTLEDKHVKRMSISVSSEVPLKTIQALVKYIYTGHLVITRRTVFSMKSVAMALNIHEVVVVCNSFIRDEGLVDNRMVNKTSSEDAIQKPGSLKRVTRQNKGGDKATKHSNKNPTVCEAIIDALTQKCKPIRPQPAVEVSKTVDIDLNRVQKQALPEPVLSVGLSNILDVGVMGQALPSQVSSSQAPPSSQVLLGTFSKQSQNILVKDVDRDKTRLPIHSHMAKDKPYSQHQMILELNTASDNVVSVIKNEPVDNSEGDRKCLGSFVNTSCDTVSVKQEVESDIGGVRQTEHSRGDMSQSGEGDTVCLQQHQPGYSVPHSIDSVRVKQEADVNGAWQTEASGNNLFQTDNGTVIQIKQETDSGTSVVQATHCAQDNVSHSGDKDPQTGHTVLCPPEQKPVYTGPDFAVFSAR